MGGMWDVYPAGADHIHWHLYPDPHRNREHNPGDQVFFEEAATMPDNGWFSATIPNTEAARNGGVGDFYYHLVADWVTTASDRRAEQLQGGRGRDAVSAGRQHRRLRRLRTARPVKFPATTYDGSFVFRFFVDAPTTVINLYDGDMDRGDDTDDANSPNLPPNLTGAVTDPLTTWPPFQTSFATRNPAEGAYPGFPRTISRSAIHCGSSPASSTM